MLELIYMYTAAILTRKYRLHAHFLGFFGVNEIST
jgi:hypothetical protein